MGNFYFLSFVFIISFFESVSQERTIITSRHVGEDAYENDLLVLKYEKLDSTSVVFTRGVNSEELKKFILEENENIASNNKALHKIFHKHYIYKYRLVHSKDLSHISVKRHPYLLVQTPVKLIKNNKSVDKGVFTYSYYIYDRRNDRKFADINVVKLDRWQTLKVIIQELGMYLQEQENIGLYE